MPSVNDMPTENQFNLLYGLHWVNAELRIDSYGANIYADHVDGTHRAMRRDSLRKTGIALVARGWIELIPGKNNPDKFTPDGEGWYRITQAGKDAFKRYRLAEGIEDADFDQYVSTAIENLAKEKLDRERKEIKIDNKGDSVYGKYEVYMQGHEKQHVSVVDNFKSLEPGDVEPTIRVYQRNFSVSEIDDFIEVLNKAKDVAMKRANELANKQA